MQTYMDDRSVCRIKEKNKRMNVFLCMIEFEFCLLTVT